MRKPISRTFGTLILFATTAALLTSIPAAGADRFPGETQYDTEINQPTNVNDSTAPEPIADPQVPFEEGEQLGPVGNVDIPTFDTVWIPGVKVPSEVTAIVNNVSADLKVIKPTDQSFLMALISIEDKDAPIEYHFKNAIPNGYTAKIHDDGSIRFYDGSGNSSGGIAIPWALDQQGTDIPTSYRLDGTTLIQYIEHSNAQYPVIADPLWIPVILTPVAIRIAIVTPTIYRAYQTCARSQCVAVARKVVRRFSQPTGGSGSSGNCFSWDKSGCS